jgi:hypothetical protein
VTPAKSKGATGFLLSVRCALEDVNQSLKKFRDGWLITMLSLRNSKGLHTPQTRDSVGNIMDRTLDFQYSGNQPN